MLHIGIPQCHSVKKNWTSQKCGVQLFVIKQARYACCNDPFLDLNRYQSHGCRRIEITMKGHRNIPVPLSLFEVLIRSLPRWWMLTDD